MADSTLKTGNEILDQYFKDLGNNPELDEDLRNAISDLWKQKRLYTKTYLSRSLDEIIEKKSK
jgi:hypothetical protein